MAIVSLLLALTPIVAQGRPAAPPPTMPPNVLNVVHHKLKRGTTAAYQTLEASIVAAYKRAKVPSFHGALRYLEMQQASGKGNPLTYR